MNRGAHHVVAEAMRVGDETISLLVEELASMATRTQPSDRMSACLRAVCQWLSMRDQALRAVQPQGDLVSIATVQATADLVDRVIQ